MTGVEVVICAVAVPAAVVLAWGLRRIDRYSERP